MSEPRPHLAEELALDEAKVFAGILSIEVFRQYWHREPRIKEGKPQ